MRTTKITSRVFYHNSKQNDKPLIGIRVSQPALLSPLKKKKKITLFSIQVRPLPSPRLKVCGANPAQSDFAQERREVPAWAGVLEFQGHRKGAAGRDPVCSSGL
jgi:hypothetical protein